MMLISLRNIYLRMRIGRFCSSTCRRSLASMYRAHELEQATLAATLPLMTRLMRAAAGIRHEQRRPMRGFRRRHTGGAAIVMSA